MLHSSDLASPAPGQGTTLRELSDVAYYHNETVWSMHDRAQQGGAMDASDDERGRRPGGGSGADDGAMPTALTVGQAAAWIGRSPGGLRLAIARGLLRAEQHVSPLQPRP